MRRRITVITVSLLMATGLAAVPAAAVSVQAGNCWVVNGQKFCI
jgi:acetyl-CoA acetyltransferase